jgi:hypothetical protein
MGALVGCRHDMVSTTREKAHKYHFNQEEKLGRNRGS